MGRGSKEHEDDRCMPPSLCPPPVPATYVTTHEIGCPPSNSGGLPLLQVLVKILLASQGKQYPDSVPDANLAVGWGQGGAKASLCSVQRLICRYTASV